jgi:60 kDa SS-A/Ro ribonucleoprotein
MARVGFSNKALAIKNAEGGTVYSISNPADKLVSMATYLGEPGFYPDKAAPSNALYNSGILDEKGTQILETAIQLAKSNSPERLLIIAKWARQEMNMRLFPQILVAAGAKFIRGSDTVPNPVSKYVPFTCSRPDDLLQLLALYNSLFGTWEEGYPRARLPGCLQKGMAFALMSYSDYSLIKYNNTNQHPTFKDLLLAVRGSVLPKRYHRKEGFPVSKGMFEFLVNGKIIEEAPRILQARKELLAFNDDALMDNNLEDLAIEAGFTWENFISKFGHQKNKQAVWSIAFKLMPYMATLRNLRNALEHNVDGLGEIIAKVCKKENVLNSKQLPFRYYSAYKALAGLQFGKGKNKALNSLEDALNVSIENLPNITGDTAVFVDNSGSMGSCISKKSSLTMADAGNILGALIHKKGINSFAFPFGTIVTPVNLLRAGSVIANAKELGSHSRVHGHGTDAGACIKYLIDNDIKVDRIIILSDLQTYGERWSGKTFQNRLDEYRSMMNSDVWLHSVNLAANGFSMARANHSRVNLIGGFSEKIINMILKEEDQNDTVNKPIKLTKLKDIIANHKVVSVDGLLAA